MKRMGTEGGSPFVKNANDGSTTILVVNSNQDSQRAVIPQSFYIPIPIRISDASNVAFGLNSLFNLIGFQGFDTFNTGIGYKSLYSCLDGYFNTAVGGMALYNCYQGYENSSFGYHSLFNIINAFQNSAFGNQALYSCLDGYQNSAVGYRSLYTCDTGFGNSGNGAFSLNSCTSGYLNSAHGFQALFNLINEINCSGIGNNAQVTGSNQVQLGNSSTTTYAYGAVQNRSDSRDKADIEPEQLGLEFIEALNPVSFRWDMREDYREPMPENPEGRAEWVERNKLANITRDGSKKRKRKHHGLIAQDVKRTLEQLNIDFGGFQDHKIAGGDDVMSIGYNELIGPMIKAIQELSAKVDQLTQRVAELEA